MRRLVLLSVLVLGLSGLSASADTVVQPGPETPLTTILDTLYGSGNYVRVSDVSDNTWWQIVNPGGATVVAKYAGNNNALWTAAIGGALDTWVVNGAVGNTGNIAANPNPFLFADVTTDGSLSLSGNNYFVSDAALHNGEDHMVTFKLLGAAYQNTDTYVIAWEDLRYLDAGGGNRSDLDFNDLVVEVSGVKPVPDGGSTVALLGGAIALVGALGRKLRK